jgi:hypothetical protein
MKRSTERAFFSLAPLILAPLALAELPVREVTLYKHGVGYFSRSGDLRAGESARLDFKAAEMNDVLKSLTVENGAGGKIASLRYDSSESLAQKLQAFPFKIGEQLALSGILDQWKGSRLELRIGSEIVSGTILGARIAIGDEKRAQREQVTLLLEGGEIRTFDLDGVAGVKLADARLQKQLSEYLAAVAQSRSDESRSVYIDSPGAAASRITANYMVPAAIWKSSYRLIFSGAPQPTLEGWAIVDNTTSDDWNDVRLALVSGRPISFVTQLYEPRYRVRPPGELADDPAAGPVVHAADFEADAAEARVEPRQFATARLVAPKSRVEGVAGSVPGGVIGGIAGNAPAAAPPPPHAKAELAASSINIAAQGRDLGDLFEYRFDSPVTVRKGQSAMLPFLQQKIGSRKLLIFSDNGSIHPTSAAELTNTTGKTLDGGPITVYDKSAYAGEALVETLKAGDKRLISYAVDLGTRVTTTYDSRQENVRELKLHRGILTTRAAVQETKAYTARNVDGEAKTLIVEHPVRPDYKLVALKPSETTSTHYRFEIKLGPKATETLAVNEERVYDTQVSISNLSPDVLLTYVRSKSIGEAARKQLEPIAARKREIAEAANTIQSLETEIREVSTDQARIRQNLESLNRVSGQQEQVARYSRDLAAQESRLATLRDSLAEQRRKRTALESELNSMIEKLEI